MPLLSRALGRVFAERSLPPSATPERVPGDHHTPSRHSPAPFTDDTHPADQFLFEECPVNVRQPAELLPAALLTEVFVTSVPESLQNISTDQFENWETGEFVTHNFTAEPSLPENCELPATDAPSNAATAATPPDANESRGWVPELREPLETWDRQPSWAWPAICQQLLAATGNGFGQLAEELSDVCTSRGYRTIALAGNGFEVGTTSIVLTLAYVLVNQPVCRSPRLRGDEPVLRGEEAVRPMLPPPSGGVSDLLRVLSSRHILLVDADIRHPSMARRLGLAPTIGWEHVLAGQTDLGGALMTLQPGRLSLLPSVSAGPAGAASLSGLNRAWQLVGDRQVDSRWRESWPLFLRKLREHFDFVFIDAGSWEMAEQLLFGPQAGLDAAISVTRCPTSSPPALPEQGGTRSSLEAEVEICRRAGAEWLGRIETFTPPNVLDHPAAHNPDTTYSTPSARTAVAS